MADIELTDKNSKPRMPMAQKVYKGVLMYENEIEEIENMGTRQDDIWVITFPRSGKLLQEIRISYQVFTINITLKHIVSIFCLEKF